MKSKAGKERMWNKRLWQAKQFDDNLIKIWRKKYGNYRDLKISELFAIILNI